VPCKSSKARAGAARSLAGALERFADSLAKRGEERDVADGFIAGVVVTWCRTCGAASRGFV
jgi:hypothetical protein